jgi:hypothetical protein
MIGLLEGLTLFNVRVYKNSVCRSGVGGKTGFLSGFYARPSDVE